MAHAAVLGGLAGVTVLSGPLPGPQPIVRVDVAETPSSLLHDPPPPPATVVPPELRPGARIDCDVVPRVLPVEEPETLEDPFADADTHVPAAPALRVFGRGRVTRAARGDARPVDAPAAAEPASPPEPPPEPYPPVVEVSRPAAPLLWAPPAYPERARRLGLEGDVVVEVDVLADGRVAAARVVHSSKYAVLDRAAVAAVLEWTFRPALEAGRAVDDVVRLRPIRFRLTGNNSGP